MKVLIEFTDQRIDSADMIVVSLSDDHLFKAFLDASPLDATHQTILRNRATGQFVVYDRQSICATITPL